MLVTAGLDFHQMHGPDTFQSLAEQQVTWYSFSFPQLFFVPHFLARDKHLLVHIVAGIRARRRGRHYGGYAVVAQLKGISRSGMAVPNDKMIHV